MTGKCYFDSYLKFSFNFPNGNLPRIITRNFIVNPTLTEPSTPAEWITTLHHTSVYILNTKLCKTLCLRGDYEMHPC